MTTTLPAPAAPAPPGGHARRPRFELPALAALLIGRVAASGKRVGVLLSGGNVDTARFARLMAESGA